MTGRVADRSRAIVPFSSSPEPPLRAWATDGETNSVRLYRVVRARVCRKYNRTWEIRVGLEAGESTSQCYVM
jgi:hypothetical protein